MLFFLKRYPHENQHIAIEPHFEMSKFFSRFLANLILISPSASSSNGIDQAICCDDTPRQLCLMSIGGKLRERYTGREMR